MNVFCFIGALVCFPSALPVFFCFAAKVGSASTVGHAALVCPTEIAFRCATVAAEAAVSTIIAGRFTEEPKIGIYYVK